MTSIRRLEQRLAAWGTFRGIARSARTLAAAQVRVWTQQLEHVDAYRRWCVRLCPDGQEVRGTRGLDARGSGVLAIGTDLGLCGHLNAKVAEAARELGASGPRIAIGRRLQDRLPGWALVGAPSAFAAAEEAATQVLALLGDAPDLTIVLANAVEADGSPRVAVQPESVADTVDHGPELAELSARSELVMVGAGLVRHARVVAAITRAVASEAEARWRTMHRAHDAASRRIVEQEREVGKLRKEMLTQEMLEARQGGRAGRARDHTAST